MNRELLKYLENDDIHFIECKGKWCNSYGYEKSQMKEDIINYIKSIQQREENLIKYLEDKIKELKEEISHFNLWHEVGTDLNYLILQKQWYEDILERIKNNNYD